MQAAFHNNRQRCGTSNAHKEGEALVCSRSYVGVWAGYGPRQEPHGQWGVSCRTPRGRRWAPRSPQGHPPCRPSWRRQTQPCEADRRADTTGWRVRKADVGKQVRLHPLCVTCVNHNAIALLTHPAPPPSPVQHWSAPNDLQSSNPHTHLHLGRDTEQPPPSHNPPTPFEAQRRDSHRRARTYHCGSISPTLMTVADTWVRFEVHITETISDSFRSPAASAGSASAGSPESPALVASTALDADSDGEGDGVPAAPLLAEGTAVPEAGEGDPATPLVRVGVGDGDGADAPGRGVAVVSAGSGDGADTLLDG
jgi:hypothetical protein